MTWWRAWGTWRRSHAKDRARSLFDVSRQWVSKSMKEAAVSAGLDPHGPTPMPSGTPTGERHPQRGSPRRCSSSGWDTIPWRRLSGTCNWRVAITTG